MSLDAGLMACHDDSMSTNLQPLSHMQEAGSAFLQDSGKTWRGSQQEDPNDQPECPRDPSVAATGTPSTHIPQDVVSLESDPPYPSQPLTHLLRAARLVVPHLTHK